MTKYVAITPMGGFTKIRPAPSPVGSDYASSCSSYTADDCSPKGKKRRLDHLTWDEKVQRKKLKNRVAAQTSRDRKKLRFEEMEMELSELNNKTDILENKCESLQAINDALFEKNKKLDKELETLRQQLDEMKKQQHKLQQEQQQQQISVATCAGCESILNGSAVSKYTDPLQQGSINSDSQSTQEQQRGMKNNQTLAALWRIVALCLLYKTSVCSTKNSMPSSWRNSQKACLPISHQIWKQAIERAMQLLPKMQATQSDCLDQWWGPQQSAWNPANIAAQQTQTKVAA